MDKLDPKTDGASKDITAENIEALKGLFPECVTEGKVDFDVLRELLGGEIDDRPERYSFTWNGKSLARRIAQTPSTGTLRPCPEESVNWDTTQNIFIEGDNLEVLKLLQKSYHKRVKMIYIDPPYNTGNEFIYPDKYQDNLDTYLMYTGQVDSEGFQLGANAESSGRYHTNWINMMYPRLKLARNLLRDDGAIFASIDDHEIHNLRHIMDEVFGPENFVATVIWEKADSPRNSARQFSEDHDYILVYSRDPEWAPKRLARTDEANAIYENPDDDPRGAWIAGDPFANKPYSKGRYQIKGPTGRVFEPPPGRFWRISEEKFHELDRQGRIWWGPTNNARPSIKKYLSEVADLVPRTLWRKEQVGSNRTSKNEIRALFPDTPSFDTPKPVGLIDRALRISVGEAEDDALIMDFFAGSGTTGDAVYRMNMDKESEGGVRFILVQLPEPIENDKFETIADIAKSRLSGVSNLLAKGGSETSTRDQYLGFRVFKLSDSSVKQWDTHCNDLEPALLNAIENIKSDRTERDVLFEILLKYGLDLAVSVEERQIEGKTVYIVGAGALVVCLADGITLGVVEGIAALKAELQPEIMRVVFKDAGFPNDVVKTNTVQILRHAGIEDVKSL